MDTSAIENLDGCPAAVAKAATEALIDAADTFRRSVAAAERFVRNAAMSEILEVNDDATPEELTEAWESSAEKKLIDILKTAPAGATRLDHYVEQYEGYRG